MGISISQIKNPNLRQMAMKIDNEDKILNNNELQQLICIVSDLQETRLEQKVKIENELSAAEKIHDKKEAQNITLGIGGLPMGGLLAILCNSMKKVPKFCLAAGVLTSIYGGVKDVIEYYRYKEEKENITNKKTNLENDENLNSMSREIKALVAQMANGKNNKDIANYLGRNDGGSGSNLIAAKTWNEYVNAVYGVLRESPDDVDKFVNEYIPTGRAETSLDKYDQEMLEKF